MRGGGAHIHSPLRPGALDGPATMEDAVELAGAAQRDGTAIVVTTPHVRRDFVTDPSDLPDRLHELRERFARERIALELHCGGELGYEMVGSLEQRHLKTIAVGPSGASWILLEPPNEGPDEELHLAADELRGRGFGVVLAHPERSGSLMADEAAGLRRQLNHGSVLQVNAWSLAGGFGPAAERTAIWLVGSGVVTALASDAHGGIRSPELSVGLERASWGLTRSRARLLTEASPRALIEHGMPVPARAA